MLFYDRINFAKIIKNHIGTFYNYGELKINGNKTTHYGDWVTFLFIPIILSISLYKLEVRFTETYIDLIITSLSIFIGLLFSLLALVFELATKEKENRKARQNDKKTEAKYKLTKELFINIAFSIVLSLISIIVLFLTRLKPSNLISLLKENFLYYDILKLTFVGLTNIIGFFLIIEFILTLMMILKRFFVIFLNEFEES